MVSSRSMVMISFDMVSNSCVFDILTLAQCDSLEQEATLQKTNEN